MTSDTNQRRFVVGLLLCAAGIAAVVVALGLSGDRFDEESRDRTAAVTGLVLLVVGLAASASAPMLGRSSRWLWTTAGLVAAALVLHLLQENIDAESPVQRVLECISPLALYFAATSMLGFVMAWEAGSAGLRFREKNAVGLAGLPFLLAAAQTYAAFRNGAGFLTQTLGFIRVAGMILGVMQIFFLLILSWALRPRR